MNSRPNDIYTDYATSVMQAFAIGKNIECKKLGEPDSRWAYTKCPSWDWVNFTYRVESGHYTYTEYQISVMNEYRKGKKLEFYDYKTNEGWIELNGVPTWNWTLYNYRVKRDAFRPFTMEEFLEVGALTWIRYKGNSFLYRCTCVTEEGIYIGCLTTEISWKKLLEQYEFFDHSPCGMKEE